MRQVTSHRVPGLNEALQIEAIDESGPGGACHRYLVTDVEGVAVVEGDPFSERVHCLVEFQRGPIAEAGVNGISNEVLLAIVEDRLAAFQAGPYACPENGFALEAIRRALEHLKRRTLGRIARGVEGTSEL